MLWSSNEWADLSIYWRDEDGASRGERRAETQYNSGQGGREAGRQGGGKGVRGSATAHL
jgi:hypothetical protein